MCGTAHIGNLGSRENILKAKLEILEGMKEDSDIIINNDNDMLHQWYLENKDTKNIMTYGIQNKSDIMAKNIIELEEGTEFEVEIEGKTYHFKINIGGLHFVINALCAICVGLKNNILVEKISEGISKFELTKNRMELVETKTGVKIINDTYNAGYDSMKAGIEYLSKKDADRKIAILGDMLELGEFSKELHEKIGEEVYKNKIDILITVGENSKHISSKALSMGMSKENIFEYDTNEEAIAKAKEIMRKGDYILVKASNSMNFKQIVEEISK